MKPGYFLYIELISNKKFQRDQIQEVKNSIESNEDFVIFSDLIVEGMELNFNSYLEIYVEDQPFESDIFIEVEKLITKVESLVSGGWSKDSKIEWISESSQMSIVWFKDDEKWKSIHRPLERNIIEEEKDWDDYDNPPNYYSNYDDDY